MGARNSIPVHFAQVTSGSNQTSVLVIFETKLTVGNSGFTVYSYEAKIKSARPVVAYQKPMPEWPTQARPPFGLVTRFGPNVTGRVPFQGPADTVQLTFVTQ